MQVLANELNKYLSKQLVTFFPDGKEVESNLASPIATSLKELKECFSYINNKYFTGNFEQTFSYLNGDHYAMFLYKVCHNVYCQTHDEVLASKVFNLNKALHGIDAFYKIKLPSIFLFVHPLGTVLGNAVYSDFFCVYQGCTIGSKTLGVYPVLKGRTILYSNSTLIGSTTLGSDVILGSGATVIDQVIPAKTLVLGVKPNQKLNEVNPMYFDMIFKTR